MKALLASYSLGREVWDRLRSKVLRQSDVPHALSLDMANVPEPHLVGPRWVKIRCILSSISGVEEDMILRHDPSIFGPYLTFPFIPGSEVMGIVTEAGATVEGIELGQRVVVNPLLSCGPREVTPMCPSCSRGDPSTCRSFAKGSIGPGIVIGACADTGGGWGDVVLAHGSQVRAIPPVMESEQAILVPELARAVGAILRFPPRPGDRVIVVGAGSLGLLTVIALQRLGFNPDLLVVAEHSYEADLVRSMSDADVVLAHSPGSCYEEVAAFVKGVVRFPEAGRLTLEGGAHLVYETAGTPERMEDALRFTGEGMQLVLMNPGRTSGCDMAPLWLKGIKIHGTAFSGTESYEGKERVAFDIAMELATEQGLPVDRLISHRFKLDEYRQALTVLADRVANRAVKVLLTHVV